MDCPACREHKLRVEWGAVESHLLRFRSARRCDACGHAQAGSSAKADGILNVTVGVGSIAAFFVSVAIGQSFMGLIVWGLACLYPIQMVRGGIRLLRTDADGVRERELVMGNTKSSKNPEQEACNET